MIGTNLVPPQLTNETYLYKLKNPKVINKV